MAGPPTRHRIFIAAELAPALREEIVALEERLQRAGAALRWIPAANLHFTVRFLGEIPPAQVALVKQATRQVAAVAAPFRLLLRGVGAFPSLQRPQVVWVGVQEGSRDLAALSSALNRALLRHGFPPEDRPFVAHLTLARLRDRRVWGDVVRALSGFQDVEVGAQQVGALAVIESHLHSRAARYVRLEEVLLGHPLNLEGQDR